MVQSSPGQRAGVRRQAKSGVTELLAGGGMTRQHLACCLLATAGSNIEDFIRSISSQTSTQSGRSGLAGHRIWFFLVTTQYPGI